MTQYRVDGMTCGGCAASIIKVLKAEAPSATVEVDFKTGIVEVDGIDAAVVERLLEEAGFDFVGPG